MTWWYLEINFGFVFPLYDMLFVDDVFWWLDEIWKICFGLGFHEIDILLIEIELWLDYIWNVCLGFAFPEKDIVFFK